MENRYVNNILSDDISIKLPFGSNMNMAVIGTPGCGKTFSVCQPNIRLSGCSMVIDDKKGTLYRKHKSYLEEAGYQVYNLDLINFSGNARINPLDSIVNREDIKRVAYFLIPESRARDPFWDDSARILLEALLEIYYNMNSEEKSKFVLPEEFSFKGLMRLISSIEIVEDRCGNTKDDIVDNIIQCHQLRGKDYRGLYKYKDVKNAATDTWKSIKASLVANLSALDSDRLFEVTSETSVDIVSIAKEKTALFITSSDTDSTYSALVKLLYNEICHHLIKYADSNCSKDDGKLPNHVKFILDDFASGTRMHDFENVIANCRSRNISFMLSFQSVSQLEALYGRSSTGIMDCLNYKIHFPSVNFETQRAMSLLMNVPVEEIQRMKADEIIVERIYMKPEFSHRFNMIKLLESEEVKNLSGPRNDKITR